MDAKLERNKTIYEEREAGTTYSELARRYEITPNCVRIIYEREKKKEELKEHQYYKILSSLTDNEEMITRTIHMLQRNALDSNEAILNVTRKQLMKCRLCGEVMTDLVLKVADILREKENGASSKE